jgi:hypothetical protein
MTLELLPRLLQAARRHTGLAAHSASLLSLRSKPLEISQYGEGLLLLLQAARRARRPRRLVMPWVSSSLRSEPPKSVITLLRLLHAATTTRENLNSFCLVVSW